LQGKTPRDLVTPRTHSDQERTQRQREKSDKQAKKERKKTKEKKEKKKKDKEESTHQHAARAIITTACMLTLRAACVRACVFLTVQLADHGARIRRT
jgi:cation transport ATPase